MTNIKTKIGAGLAAAAMMGSVVAPSAFAGTTIEISGNGGSSASTAIVETSHRTTVEQGNEAVVSNSISVEQNTGDNSADGNTGNDSNNSVVTGDATSDILIDVEGSSNTASIDDCGCESDEEITISDNGRDSRNTARVERRLKKRLSQWNFLSVGNSIQLSQNTGDNSADDNTGRRSRNRVRTGHTSGFFSIFVGGSSNSN